EGVGIKSAYPLLVPFATRLDRYLHAPICVYPNGEPHTWFLYLVYATSTLLVIFAVVGCCNATNLMDGLDGLCGGVTAVIAAGFLFLAAHMATSTSVDRIDEDAQRVIMGLALLGGVLAFVPFNFNPASIFMGDTGSMFLGFCCATMMVLFAANGNEDHHGGAAE